MLQKRIIPLLLLSENKIVKTERFKNISYVGDPLNILKIFNEKEVDEIILLDISKRKKNYNLQTELLKQFASECFMPISYGGGIETLEDAEFILNMGFEKICLTNAALKNPKLIKEISDNFGKQSVVVKLDLKKNFFRKLKVYNYFDDNFINEDINDYIKKIISFGAGEIIVNFVDKEGTRTGLHNSDLEIIDLNIEIPIIISGGINSYENIKDLLSLKVDALAVGSLLVYFGVHKAVLISYPNKSEKKELIKPLY